MEKILIPVLLILMQFSVNVAAQNKDNPASVALVGDHFLLTVFLKHDQSRPLGELLEQQNENGFSELFPPEGIEVESWYVMMGIGQVVTLRVPPSRLREINRAIEHGAWGAFTTEFYPTYDLKDVMLERRGRTK